ncbi:MAG: T9SS type A sorting domain-containing protein [Bacteroidales bacterium]|nr:T9SS type A sorting domain-containing protein [Bacteroidales bacterium]
MKAIIITISILFILSQQSTLKAQQWDWSIGFTNNSTSKHCLESDNDGNSFFSFSFSHIYTPIIVNTNGETDIFLGKVNNSGTIIWHKGFGGDNQLIYPFPFGSPFLYNEYINSIEIDNINSYIYVSGMFYDSCSIDGFTLIATTPTKHQGFMMKLDFDGNIIWAKEQKAEITGLALSNDGNLLACGISYTSFVFNSELIGAGGFIAKFDIAGNEIWAKSKFPMSGEEYGFIPWKIKTDESSIFINCKSDEYINAETDTIRFDTITYILEPNDPRAAIVCLDMEGNAKWLSVFGGICGNDFVLDSFSNIYSVGSFLHGTGYFGNDTITTQSTQWNFFLTKHNSLGEIQWVKHLDGFRSEGFYISNIVDSAFYVIGDCYDSVYFDSDTIPAKKAIGNFVANFKLDGSFQFVKFTERGAGLAVSQDNNKNAFTIFWGTDLIIGDSVYNIYAGTYIAKLTHPSSIVEELKTTPAGSLLTIYANPNSGICNITIPEEFEEESELTLYIYDLNGKLIQESKIELFEETIRVNIQSQAKGIYNAVLGNGRKKYYGKIVFE